MFGSQYIPKHNPSRKRSFFNTFLLDKMAISSAEARSIVRARSSIRSCLADGASSPGERIMKMEMGVSRRRR